MQNGLSNSRIDVSLGYNPTLYENVVHRRTFLVCCYIQLCDATQNLHVISNMKSSVPLKIEMLRQWHQKKLIYDHSRSTICGATKSRLFQSADDRINKVGCSMGAKSQLDLCLILQCVCAA